MLVMRYFYRWFPTRLVLFLTAFYVMTAGAETKPPLVMSIVQKESDYYGRLFSRIYTEAFRRIGHDVDIRYYPINRSLMMLERKQIDGELARTPTFHQRFPHLIIVSEPSLTMRFSAFSASPTLKVNGWSSIINTRFRVDYIRGSTLVKQVLNLDSDPEFSGGDKRNRSENFSPVNNWGIGLRKLLAGRSDFFISFEGAVRFALDSPEFQGQRIFNAGLIEEYDVHAFFQPGNEAIAEALAVALKEMKREGLIAQFEQQVFNSRYAHHSLPESESFGFD